MSKDQRTSKHITGVNPQSALDIRIDVIEDPFPILADEEFVDATIHRLGEHVPKGTPKPKPDLDAETLLPAVEAVLEISRDEICGRSKAARTVRAKEMLILCDHRHGASLAELARLTGLNSSTIARRLESARTSHHDHLNLRELASQVMKIYENERIA